MTGTSPDLPQSAGNPPGDRAPGARRPQALRALLSDPARVSALVDTGEPVPDEVVRWLTRLRLLRDLPFGTIVPDARMLPPESIRFFFVDDNWLDALVDGALSAVARPGPTAALLEILRPAVQAAVAAAIPAERAGRLARVRTARGGTAAKVGDAGVAGNEPTTKTRQNADKASASHRPTADGPDADPAPVTGFLLRSTAVADWPGLRIAGYAAADGTRPLDLLRLDRTAPDVLLALFDGVLARADITTPTQDTGFAIRRDATDPTFERVVLRGLGGRFRAGVELPGNESVPLPLRADRANRAVVDIAALHGRLVEALGWRYAPDPLPPLRSAGLALHLVDAGEVQILAGWPEDGMEP